MSQEPGLVVLFSSGETSPGSQQIYDWLLSRVDPPIHMAVLETPAGFQPNTSIVAEKVADFVRHHLQNHRPETTVVPARKRGTAFSPDSPEIVAPLLQANVIFAGAGSPTYAVRQLRDSLAWHTLVARHRLGAAVVLASAATIAAGTRVLPVYEIYKVGEDLHWVPGLDLMGAYGLSLALISHWDNKEGGADLDTSRGFLGRQRFSELLDMLPQDTTVVGIDEHTALVLDVAGEVCHVQGRGGVCLCQGGEERTYPGGESFAIHELGPFVRPAPDDGIPLEVWERVRSVDKAQAKHAAPPPPAALALVEQREAARARRDWAAADAVREELSRLGYQVEDTPQGPRLRPIDSSS